MSLPPARTDDGGPETRGHDISDDHPGGRRHPDLCNGVNIAFHLDNPGEPSPFEMEIWESSGGQRPLCPPRLFSG